MITQSEHVAHRTCDTGFVLRVPHNNGDDNNSLQNLSRLQNVPYSDHITLFKTSLSSFHFFQIIYFGLQYMNKNYKTRWVDLEKPLKKQLDKNAHDPVLRFGVMLYVSNITKLRQEITR